MLGRARTSVNVSRLFGPKVALARATGAVSRRSGRGGGTTLPGRMLLRLAPDAIGRLAVSLERGSTIISATNGKTTTAGMLAAILRADGRFPVHNRAGSNMSWGSRRRSSSRAAPRACSRWTKRGFRQWPRSSSRA